MDRFFNFNEKTLTNDEVVDKLYMFWTLNDKKQTYSVQMYLTLAFEFLQNDSH